MASATVTETRKISKCFYATLRDEAGTLAKLNGEILFFSDVTGDIITIEPEDCVWLCVLGECGISDTQQIMDTLHHGYAAIACTRPMIEVA